MKILVTGSGGFIGGYLKNMVENHTEKKFIFTDKEEFNILDKVFITQFLIDNNIGTVIHLAALCGAIPSVNDPESFFEVNTVGTINLLNACKAAKVKNFIFFSSLTVFGQNQDNELSSVDEDSKINPKHPYAASKAAGEVILQNFCKVYGLKGIIFRPTLVIGENYKEPHAIGDFIETVLKNKDILIYGEGNHIRDFVHPLDVCNLLLKMIDYIETQQDNYCDSFNLSNGDTFNMLELARLITKTIGKGNVINVEKSTQAFSLYTSNKKVKDILNFECKISNSEIIDRLIKSYKF